MGRLRRLVIALTMAVMVAGAAATLEASNGGNKKTGTLCSYLASVINYTYVSPDIQAYALSLFYANSCDPSLLN